MTEHALRRIREMAADPNASVPDLLRLCLELAFQRHSQDLERWSASELNGYNEGEELPRYRVIKAPVFLRMGAPLVGERVLPIPEDIVRQAMVDDEDIERWNTIRMHDSIARVTYMLSTEGELEREWPAGAVRKLDRFINQKPIRAWNQLQKADLAVLVDAVKSQALAYALELSPAEADRGNQAEEARGDQAALEVIAQIFHAREEAVNLLKSVDFPASRIPDFPNSTVFWGRVFEEARNGVLLGGIRPIIESAVTRYPYNEKLAACLKKE